MRYRRAQVQGGTYFFTVVTYQRIEILSRPENVALPREAFKRVKKTYPFRIDAIVLLPEHLHCIWTLPQNDADFSTRWRLIKSYFSRKLSHVCWSAGGGETPTHKPISASRSKKSEKTIWQRRFWEHLIRDEQDLKHHVEYIHYNPVKHGLVKSPKDWAFSSFHRYVNNGVYDLEWGAGLELEFKSTIGSE
jgi:putative transposase